MAGRIVHVGVREFRDELSEYLDSETPLVITRHGQTIGYYIPAQPKREEDELLALNRAIEQLQTLLADHQISEDEVVREFRNHRSHP